MNQKRAKFFADEIDIPSAFEEAVEFFLAKGVIVKEFFEKLDDLARRAAFSIVADTRTYIIAETKRYLAEALEAGGSLDDFKDKLFGYFERMGVTSRKPYYYDVVFNTNIQEALSRGKDVIFEQADREEFPYRQFLTVGDDRVRSSHRELDGFTAPVDDPIWRRLKVPLDYNCRCSITLVHADEGLSPTGKDDYPDTEGEGFNFLKNPRKRVNLNIEGENDETG